MNNIFTSPVIFLFLWVVCSWSLLKSKSPSRMEKLKTFFRDIFTFLDALISISRMTLIFYWRNPWCLQTVSHTFKRVSKITYHAFAAFCNENLLQKWKKLRSVEMLQNQVWRLFYVSYIILISMSRMVLSFLLTQSLMFEESFRYTTSTFATRFVKMIFDWFIRQTLRIMESSLSD